MSRAGNGSLAAVLALAGLCAGAAAPLPAAQLVNSLGGCIDIARGDTTDGSQLILFHCHGSPNQNWTVSGGTLAGDNGVCIDIMGSRPVPGAQIIIVKCNGRASQQWQVNGGALMGPGNTCIDTTDGSSADSTPLVLAACKPGTGSQTWTIE
ncbi:MAG: ricin-type beta-trefoil lectin domain protein [Proteobacteria bacterium]|nr:ricin-type beta-trefoil lectin domain protein [Pseudomonadota bacterium]